jgi:ATP-dependent Clp protease ATP-binding subunit ClpX
MPTPEEIQRELKRFMKERFGDNVIVGIGPTGGTEPPAGQFAQSQVQKPGRSETIDQILQFNLRPKEVKAYLDRFVIEQEDAKKALSIAVCDHYNHVRRAIERKDKEEDYVKQNILLLGPTGVGKTYLIRSIARLIGVPFVRADATKFSETGYVGGDVEDLVRDLVRAADRNLELAEFGIIYLDEVDKIARGEGMVGRDVSGRGVQTNLLKLMEDTDVTVKSQTDVAAQMQELMEMQMRGQRPERKTVNTRHILFIVSGAFAGLEEIIRKRVSRSGIGFSGEPHNGEHDREMLRKVSTDDLIQFGFEPEFVGRLPIRVVCDTLDANDLYRILKYSEGSILRQYRSSFDAYNIDVHFTDEALRAIAERAAEEHTGARGLVTVLEKTLREFKYELPSTGIQNLEVTEQTVKSPHTSLNDALQEVDQIELRFCRDQVNAFARGFEERYGVALTFNETAVAAIWELSRQKGLTSANLIQDLFKDFEFGLKLITENTGQREFELDAEAVTNPEQWLSNAVRSSYTEPRKSPPASMPDDLDAPPDVDPMEDQQ